MHNTVLQPLRILLLGYGSVATALLPLLAARSQWLAQEPGISLLISGIGTRRQGFLLHPHGVETTLLAREEHPLLAFRHLPETRAVADAAAFLQVGKDTGASLLIELTTLHPQDGQPALSHIRQALMAGMDVVTANKGPIAYAQAELQKLARRHHVQLRFESTVMDGLPLLNLAQFTLQAVGIFAFRALLNTTSSLVLSMIEQGSSLEAAIERAQALGIAEADPWYDLDGWDAAMKTTILANNLLNAQITPLQVRREGIRHLSLDAIREAASAGTPIRLVSRGELSNGLVRAEVMPQRILPEDILHVGKGTTSVISLDTEAMGTMTLVEHEPVVLQTAYGVLSDLITVVRQQRKRW